jgi:multiple sugar transport system permease protein
MQEGETLTLSVSSDTSAGPRTRIIPPRFNRQNIIGIVVTYLALAVMTIAFLLPFAWMVSTSLKTPAQVLQYPPVWIPSPPVPHNFLVPWEMMPMARYFFNSAVVATVIVGSQLGSSSLAAFAFARLRFPGKRLAFLLTLCMIMVPVQVTLIPLYLSVSRLGLVNSYAGLVFPFLSSSFGTFLLRQFFLTIPVELVDAARIDGGSFFRVYYSVFLPLSKTALATLAVFTFLQHWNSFLWPLIITSTDDMKVWTLGLLNFNGLYGIEYHFLMAGTLIGLLPPLVAFVFLQRYFIEGVALTGIHGR